MNALDLAAFRRVPLTRAPFQYLVVPAFVPAGMCAAVNAHYPRIDRPGSFPVGGLSYGTAFEKLLAALEGPAFRAAVEDKFDIDLTGRPTLITVRGQCGPRDGSIHTDAKSKVITVLLYLNSRWEADGGRLRLLRGADDIDDVIVEVPPVEGTLVAFRRSDNSWHGHLPHIGPRRVVQLNWVRNAGSRGRHLARHRMSAWVKKAASLFLLPSRAA
jgi:hypothetical protein